MSKLVVFLIGWLLLLAGCTQGNQKPLKLDPVEVASEEELMNFYKGLHQVGVRLLAEDAGEGGRANLQRFNALYFTGNEQQAQKHLRMSLFADPFNTNSKAVAAQLESTDLFGLLSDEENIEDRRQITLNEHESFPDLSTRVYGNEHYAVLLQRYNAEVNPEYQKTRQVYAPELDQLPVLQDYFQPGVPKRPVARAENTTPAPTRIPPAQTQTDGMSITSSELEVIALEEEPANEKDQPLVLETAIEPEDIPQSVTPQELYQQGHSVAAYRLLMNQAASERDQSLYDRLRELLVETPYREGVSHFHAQEVGEAMEKFRRVLSIEPGHARAQQYMDRAMRLNARLSDID